MQIYSKNNKNCFFSLISWPIFIVFVLSDRARWRLQNLYTKFWNSLIMLIYANLRSPGRDPGVQSALKKKYIYIFLLLLLFFFFFHVPSGASNLYFSHSNFFIFSPFPGHQILIFWPVENCTTWNLRYLMLRDAGWALRHWRSCSKSCWNLVITRTIKMTLLSGVFFYLGKKTHQKIQIQLKIIRPKKKNCYVALTRPKFENWVGRSGFFYIFFYVPWESWVFQYFFKSF